MADGRLVPRMRPRLFTVTKRGGCVCPGLEGVTDEERMCGDLENGYVFTEDEMRLEVELCLLEKAWGGRG